MVRKTCGGLCLINIGALLKLRWPRFRHIQILFFDISLSIIYMKSESEMERSCHTKTGTERGELRDGKPLLAPPLFGSSSTGSLTADNAKMVH